MEANTALQLPSAGAEWKHNAPRHSWVSYRLATAQEAPKVALEAGNTPQMVFEHDNELVTKGQAAARYVIMPSTPANVIQATRFPGNTAPLRQRDQVA